MPVSVMAMQAAISLVTLSLHQNLIIQGIDVARFNTTLPYTEAVEEVENPIPSSNTPATPNNTQVKKRKRVNKNDEYTDVGLAMISGGKQLNGAHLNRYKKLGGNTNITRITDAFISLENAAFGV